MKVRLTRLTDTGKETIGLIEVWDKEVFIASYHTLELPWKNNEPQVSCIPAGKYPVIWTQSNRLTKLTGKSYFTYEVCNVPNRAGIRIHSANFYNQLLGCIAFGNGLSDINNDNELDVTNSRQALSDFESIMKHESFVLQVVDIIKEAA